MRIAVSSSPFRPLFAAGALTQLEWVERVAHELDADGLLPALADFPRRDGEYVAQLRKIAVDLGLVPLGIDAPGFLDPITPQPEREAALTLAREFGAVLLRSVLPAPGDVPPKAFVDAVTTAKAASRAAKAVNVTVVAAARPGTLAEDLADLRHLLKDVDSAWLRACPRPGDLREGIGPKDRFPAIEVTPAEAPEAVAALPGRPWLLLDAPPGDDALARVRAAVRALRTAMR